MDVLLYVLVPCLLFVAVALYLAMTWPITNLRGEALELRIRKLYADMDADIEANKSSLSHALKSKS